MKKQSIALAKINRPILTGIFQRKRLFKILDTMTKFRVIWVSGPPGSGKTILINSYLESCGVPCLWYQVDERDRDPANLFYFLGQAVKQLPPQNHKPLPVHTPEYIQGLSTFTLRYFETLYARLPQPYALVFDNYQEVMQNAPFHQVIRQILSAVPTGVTIFLLSRDAPPHELTRMVANHHMKILGWQKLKLTQEETAGIMEIQALEKPSRSSVQRMHKASDGWTAGLVLMIEQAKLEGIDLESMGKCTPEEIFDYFAGEIFSQIDSETQNFLLKTAFLPEMTVGMAEKLTCRSNAGRLLSYLNRNNLFTEKRFLNGPTYRYHPLFREFLLSRSEVAFSGNALTKLRRKSADILEEAGETEAVVSLLYETKDNGGIIRMIMTHASKMLTQGRNRSLEGWLARLPEEIIEQMPWLNLWLGFCFFPYNPSESRHRFEKAFTQFTHSTADKAGIFLSWSGIIESTAYAMEDMQPIDHWISVLEDLLLKYESFPTIEIEIRVTCAMLLALVYRQPQHPEMENWINRGMLLMEKIPDNNLKAQYLYQLILHRIVTGDFEKASLPVSALDHLSTTEDLPDLGRIICCMAKANLYQFTGQHEECKKAVVDGLAHSRISGVHVMDHLLLANGIICALNTDDRTMADNFFQQFDTSINTFQKTSRSLYTFLRAIYSFRQKKFNQAKNDAEMVLTTVDNTGGPFQKILAKMVLAKTYHELGRNTEAETLISEILNTARQIKSNLCTFYGLMIRAWFTLDNGEKKKGLETLEKALVLGKTHGYISIHADQPEVIATLCAIALENNIEPEYIHNIIRKRNLLPKTPYLHLENWPWPVKIYTMGRFGVTINGEPLTFSGKAQHKPLSLIKVLIAFGGRAIKEDHIADALWPDVDGDTAHHSFASTLLRLRKLINIPNAIQRQNNCVTLDHRYFWVDAWAFQRLITQAEAAWKAKARKENTDNAVRLTQQAIDFYQGPFLNFDTTEGWAISYRERLRSKFIRAVETLGDYWISNNQFKTAVGCYRKSLEKDDLAETIYQRLMTCFIKLDQKAEALHTYDRCRDTLVASLGIEPSVETERLRKKLTSS